MENEKKPLRKIKLIILFVIIAPIIFLVIVGLIPTKIPVITISEPENNISIQAERVLVKGNVNPADANVKINGLPITPDENGNFSRPMRLKNEDNTIGISASNRGQTANIQLSIKRIFTPEEIAQRKAEEAKAKAEEQAKLDAYYATPGGRICKDYPEWTEEECEWLANKKIWIGMSYKMLVYLMGKPDSANPSNYGGGIKYQYCWMDKRPSCFYDDNNDGYIDAYN